MSLSNNSSKSILVKETVFGVSDGELLNKFRKLNKHILRESLEYQGWL